MYQKDYILRMIEMMGDLIAAIFGFLKKGNLTEASRILENAYVDFLKQDAGFFRKLPLEDISDTLLRKYNYTHGHLEILSELFYAQAELFYAQGNTKESLLFFKKSLALLEFVMKESRSFSLEKQSRKIRLNERIKELIM